MLTSDRLKIGTNLQLSYVKQDKLSSSGDAPGVIRHALLRPPVISVFKSSTDPTGPMPILIQIYPSI